ncbi:MAG: energy transducer TonB [Telmatospirillum sp.]|nr:energy transducer TonB [Telmatospirillum sp.]
MNAVFRLREWLAGINAVAALLALALAPVPKLQTPKLPEETLMQVTLEQLPEPEPEPERQMAPPPPQPVPPQPVAPPRAQVPPPPDKPKVQRPRAPAMAASASRQVEPSDPAPVQSAEAPPLASPAPGAAPAPAPVAPSARAASADGEERYVSGLHGYLDSIKRYPTSREARLEHPSGEAVVWFVLDHQGTLIDAGIEKSAGSMLLDQAALSTVRRGEYKPFPPDAWGGAETHRFTVRLHFSVQQ